MTRKINLFSLKGGQGVSTTAVLLANSFALQGKSVLLLDHKGGDLSALLGTTDPIVGVAKEVTDNITLLVQGADENLTHGFDVVISDLGYFVEGAENLLVTQPCYMALRQASREIELVEKCDGAIIVRPADRCLTDQDVANVLAVKHIKTIMMNASIARASDAGVLASARRHHLSIDDGWIMV